MTLKEATWRYDLENTEIVTLDADAEKKKLPR
jgi:hypothetical protein